MTSTRSDKSAFSVICKPFSLAHSLWRRVLGEADEAFAEDRQAVEDETARLLSWWEILRPNARTAAEQHILGDFDRLHPQARYQLARLKLDYPHLVEKIPRIEPENTVLLSVPWAEADNLYEMTCHLRRAELSDRRCIHKWLDERLPWKRRRDVRRLIENVMYLVKARVDCDLAAISLAPSVHRNLLNLHLAYRAQSTFNEITFQLPVVYEPAPGVAFERSMKSVHGPLNVAMKCVIKSIPRTHPTAERVRHFEDYLTASKSSAKS